MRGAMTGSVGSAVNSQAMLETDVMRNVVFTTSPRSEMEVTTNVSTYVRFHEALGSLDAAANLER